MTMHNTPHDLSVSTDYVDLPIDLIELDKSNPRIANYLEYHTPESIDSNVMALLLETTAEACASLRESIRQNGGIIHPIVVNKRADGSYVVIEGNTRLQIYRDFVKKGIPGNWSTIRAIVYNDLADEEKHAIRLQAHLVGPREWNSYAKAKYLYHLSVEEGMPMNVLISFCGGNSKASEIRNMINAYIDMENEYRDLLPNDAEFDIRKFQGFVELQKRNIQESLAVHGYTKRDFSQWIIDERISPLADIRKLPEILKSKRAREVFLKSNTTEAKKILAVEEIASDKLKDVPYEILANELARKLDMVEMREIRHLRDDSDYYEKREVLIRVYEAVKFVLEEVGVEL